MQQHRQNWRILWELVVKIITQVPENYVKLIMDLVLLLMLLLLTSINALIASVIIVPTLNLAEMQRIIVKFAKLLQLVPLNLLMRLGQLLLTLQIVQLQLVPLIHH